MERIDVIILGLHGVKEEDITPEDLVAWITRVPRPKPHEIKVWRRINLPKETRYELFIVRDACPVRYFSGATCPICRKAHSK